MGVRALVVVLLVAACGSPSVTVIDAPGTSGSSDAGVDPNEGARSGTRLKLTWFDFTDGTRQWDGFYDAERKETCYPYANWPDGKTYCTPDSTTSVVYGDAGCTQKLGQVYRDPTCTLPPPTYLLEYRYAACGGGPQHLYLRGAKVSPAQYYTLDGSSCDGPYATTSYDFYAAGAEITPNNLVEITQAPGAATGRLATVYYASDDGMRLPTALHDSQLATDCFPETYGGGSAGICIPSNAWYANDFRDASCTQPIVGLDDSCPAPTFAEYAAATACPADPPHIASISGAVASSPLYYESGSSCLADTASATSTYFGVGGDVAAAPVTRTIDALASHRIQLVHYTTPDGLRYRDTSVYDSAKGVDCYPTDLPDGTTVCLPYGGFIDTYYRDAACTQPIDLIEVATGAAGCAPPDVPKYARKYITPVPGSCAYNIELHQVSTPYAGAVYANYGTCVAYTPTGVTLYSVAGASSLDEFVSATKSVDP